MTKRSEIIVSLVTGVTDRNPQPAKYENFEQFGKQLFEDPRVGGPKQGKAFIRGNAVGRNKEDLTQSKLLVVDADHRRTTEGHSSCHPDELKRALDAEGFRYIMHASRSNAPDKDIWRHRTIIECTEYMDSPEILEYNICKLYELLWQHEVDIGLPKEVKSWVQLWFLPNVEKEDDWFYYSNYTGRKWATKVPSSTDPDRPTKLSQAIKNGNKPDAVTKYGTDWSKPLGEVVKGLDPWEEIANNILTGQEFHDSLLKVSYAISGNKMPKNLNRLICESLLLRAPESKRRDERLLELDKMVDGAYKRRDALMTADFTLPQQQAVLESRGDMPKPGGMLGLMIDDAMSMQEYQNYQVAAVSVLGLCAGVCGRKFNIEGMGLNLYILLSMPTGSGKRFIGDYITKNITNADALNPYDSFIGAKRFTGPKALCDMLSAGRCRVSVQSEMGTMLQSTAGDQKGLTRLILDLYEYSGNGKYLAGEQYSNTDNNIDGMASPALTIVGESTPSTLLEALRSDDNIQNGLLPRFMLFKCEGKKPYANREKKRDVDDRVKNRIENLVKVCADAQVDVYQSFTLNWESDELKAEWHAYQNKWVDMTNRCRDGSDSLNEAMSNRVAAQAAKLAGLHAVINNDKSKVTREDWEWGVAMAEWCYNGVSEFMTDKDGNIKTNDSDELMMVAGKAMRSLIDRPADSGQEHNPAQKLLLIESQAGLFPSGVLNRVLNQKRSIKALSGDISKGYKATPGSKKVIEMMLSMGYIEQVEYRREVNQGGRPAKDANVGYKVTKAGSEVLLK